MTLMSVPIDSITEGHLRSLIEDQVMELRVIEYKQELPGKWPEDKREFLADVCSFANTAGGDLVYGMTENGGMPQDLPGFETSNIDDEINGLENCIKGLRLVTMQLLEKFSPIGVGTNRSSHIRLSRKFVLQAVTSSLCSPVSLRGRLMRLSTPRYPAPS